MEEGGILSTGSLDRGTAAVGACGSGDSAAYLVETISSWVETALV